MAAGRADFRQITGNERFANGVVYISEEASGQVIAYGIPGTVSCEPPAPTQGERNSSRLISPKRGSQSSHANAAKDHSNCVYRCRSTTSRAIGSILHASGSVFGNTLLHRDGNDGRQQNECVSAGLLRRYGNQEPPREASHRR